MKATLFILLLSLSLHSKATAPDNLAASGRFLINLNATGTAEFPNGREAEASIAALNAVIHSFGHLPGVIPAESKNARRGKLDLNLAGFLRREVMGAIATADPSTACTGSIRVNKLITTLVEPANYRRLIYAPPNREEFIKQYAVGSEILFSKPATDGSRRYVINALSALRGNAYRIDYFEDASSTDTKPDSEIWIMAGPNGFRREFSYNSSPDAVSAPWISCLECVLKSQHDMPDWMKKDSLAVRQAFRAAKAMFANEKNPSVPVVRDIVAGFKDPVDAAMAAKEIGATANEVRQFIPTTMNRETFENRICEIKTKLDELKSNAGTGAAVSSRTQEERPKSNPQ